MLQKVIKTYILICYLFFTQVAFGQNCKISYSGRVIDQHNSKPLVGAVIKLSSQSQVTDKNGKFQFLNICNGTYVIEVSHVGCVPFMDTVRIKKNTDRIFYLEHHQQFLDEVFIQGFNQKIQHANAATFIEEAKIKRLQGKTFGDLLQDVQGVALLKTGATITKPVINGLHSQRILTINDGVRMEGQHWGLEHAPEIDPYAVENITVVKGAGTVQYGADALGGVILTDPAKLPYLYGTTIRASGAAFSNGQSGSFSVNAIGKERIFGLPISFQVQGSLKRSGNLKSANYYLNNTATAEANFMLRAGYVGEKYGFEGKVSQFNSKLGLLSESHFGTSEDLAAALERGRPAYEGNFSYNFKIPYQKVLHETSQFKAYYKTGIGRMEVLFGRQYNRRSEFDRNGPPGLILKTETYNGQLSLIHSLFKKMNGKAGIEFSNQDFKYEGYYLIPEYNHQAIGAYLTENIRVAKKLLIEGGFRFEQKDYRYFLPHNAFRRLDDIPIEYVSESDSINIAEKTFRKMYTGSFGLSYSATKNLTLSAYTGYGIRPPLPNELYTDGVHHGSAFYQVGMPDAKPEKSRTTQFNIDYKTELFTATINSYWNKIDNFTYLQPSATHPPVHEINGFFPVQQFVQDNAKFLGFDYRLNQLFYRQKLKLETGGSFLWATDVDNKEPLILMPPNRLQHEISYSFSQKWSSRLNLRNVFEQKRVPDPTVVADYSPPPKGYNLIDLGVSYTTLFSNKNELGISALAENLLNKEYKNYLDRFRYFSHAPGFNFSIKVTYTIH